MEVKAPKRPPQGAKPVKTTASTKNTDDTTSKRKRTKRKPGRPAGSPNKVSINGRAMLNAIVEENFDKIRNELNGLEGRDYIRCMIDLMKFVYPQVSHISYDANVQVTENNVVNRLRELSLVNDGIAPRAISAQDIEEAEMEEIED